MDNTEFNPVIHELGPDGEPARKLDGSLRLRRDWKKRQESATSINMEPPRVDVGEQPPNALAQVAESMVQSAPLSVEFNQNVHESTSNGDPARNDDGSIRLKQDWKAEALDRQGRSFNKQVHGDKPILDDAGFLKVRRRGETKLVTSTIRTEAFVQQHAELGYAYYVMNDEGGRLQQFTDNDWEPVVTGEGIATMQVGQARDQNTRAILMKKPIEWYEADQRKKREMNDYELKQTSSPKEEMGQYEANPTSPLR